MSFSDTCTSRISLHFPTLTITLTLLLGAAPLASLAQHDLEGDLAPALQGENREGESVRLEDFRGKVVLVHFWIRDLGNVAQLRELATAYERKSFQMLGVCGDDRRGLLRAIEQSQISWPCIRDEDRVKLREWSAFPLPRSFLIDDKGLSALWG